MLLGIGIRIAWLALLVEVFKETGPATTIVLLSVVLLIEMQNGSYSWAKAQIRSLKSQMSDSKLG